MVCTDWLFRFQCPSSIFGPLVSSKEAHALGWPQVKINSAIVSIFLYVVQNNFLQYTLRKSLVIMEVKPRDRGLGGEGQTDRQTDRQSQS